MVIGKETIAFNTRHKGTEEQRHKVIQGKVAIGKEALTYNTRHKGTKEHRHKVI